MYDSLQLRQLEQAALSPDWMTVYLGVQGIELGWGSDADLRVEEARSLAADRLIASVGTRIEHDIFLLIESERKHDSLEYLGRLAQRDGVTELLARRKWRCAVVKDALLKIVTTEQVEPFDRAEWLYDVWFRWQPVVTDPPLPSLHSTWDEDSFQLDLNHYRLWLDEESAAIRAEEERGAVK